MTTRTTVYLDETVLSRLRHFVPSRGLSQLINELLAERLARLEQIEIEALMQEGYIATRRERLDLNRDWQVIDGEGWPE